VAGVVKPLVEDLIAAGELRRSLQRDVRKGMLAGHKMLPPVWFYDEVGSALFDEITRLPEYYLTRAERALLVEHAARIADLSGATSLVELGAGTCEKTRLLLDPLWDKGILASYVPLDVSAVTLQQAAFLLAQEYEGLLVHALIGDFRRHLGKVPKSPNQMFAFLGSTIGNLSTHDRAGFFSDLAAVMKPGDTFLLGADLVKDPKKLVRAYDDVAGVTARFNLNVLNVLNRELGANFDPSYFEHVAVWNEEESRIEMHLRATQAQAVEISSLGINVHFETGEALLTETSAKFTSEGIQAELARAGLGVDWWWKSDESEYMLLLAARS
jgi:L-histidine N-alpha-methyltransferase